MSEPSAVMEASPFGIQSKKLAMWLFIIADAATFGAMLFAYGYLRVANPDWPRPFLFSPTILDSIVMTAVLLVSCVTMVGAVSAARGGQVAAAVRWMWATLLLGVAFTVLHLLEWSSMIGEGWRPGVNPTGGPVQFGASYFSITGLSLGHVIAGVVALVVVARKFARGRLDAGHVETTGLYWQFVTLVWLFVFPLVYLLNAR
ncbi:MAG TPA: cytochrome c oxidase subunit 3 [Gemmatimonadales bacterium]|nr:cytochrome c oxidase subunit 3 [Gemmatimonadales bacterium]